MGALKLYGVGQIDNLQLLGLGIPHSIGRASVIRCQVADADAAVVNQMAVPLKHAAPVIVFRCVHHFICLMQDFIIYVHIGSRPTSGLLFAGQNKDQTNLWILFPQL